MKKTNTFLKWQVERWKFVFLLVVALGSLSVSVDAQCSLACNGSTNISLDNVDCEALVTPDMVLNDQATSCAGSTGYTVTLTDEFGNPLPTGTDPSPTNPNDLGQYVDADYLGWTIHVIVTDNDSGNSCWGLLTVEDKLAPVLTCPAAPLALFCYELDNFSPTVVDNCDTDPEIVMLSQTETQNICDGTYTDDVIRVITREYVAMDDYGNVSNTCMIEITVMRLPDLNDPLVVCPTSLFYTNGDHLLCDGTYPTIQTGPYAGNPDPSYTGVPFVDPDGIPGNADDFDLWPSPNGQACNLSVSFADTELSAIGCITKIMRTWTIFEWSCENPQRSRTCVQMIEIVDEVGPTFTCPSDMTVTTNTAGDYHDPVHGAITCAAIVDLPSVSPSDNCDNTPFTYNISFPGGSITTNGGEVELPMGDNLISYTVYDGCLNPTVCTFTISVVDNTAPVPVCDQFTVVSLTNNGEAHVYAESFDDGSYDDCALSCIVAQRMFDDPCECEIPSFGGFDYLGERNGHHYYLSHLPASSTVAAKKAHALGGYLATTRTSAERVWLHDQVLDVTTTSNYWIGLNRTGPGSSNSNFIWADGTTLTSTNWAAGEPLNAGGNENCVLVYQPGPLDGKWNDVDCDLFKHRFVVEFDDPCDAFSEYVPFCCADIGNEDLMVTFRAIDIYGNFNDCMVNVEVQDKLAPTITCPDHVVHECDYLYDIDNLATYFGDATAVDNCNVSMTETHVADINNCGIGTITRTFTATDDGGRTATCEQVITFINSDPFEEDDITWVPDVTLEGCADPTSADFHPDVIGYPQFNEDQCDLVGSNWSDAYFPFNNGNGDACFKILRTWTVIDWCQSGLPQWTDLQIIKINNTVDPVITSSCDEKTTCTFDATCQDGFIELTASATDDCTEELNWTAQVDIDNDGSFDGAYYESGNGNNADASGDYPIGNHSILWTFEDKCGNTVSCTQLFNVVNCKAPTPYCINGLAIDLMPVDTDGDGTADWGMIETWASDFDQGSFHPCGYPVTLSFSEDITDTNITFDCNTMGIQTVDIYASVVTPDGQLLQAYCTTFIDVQDNMNVCPTGGLVANIQGRVMTETDENVEDVEIDLAGGDVTEMTDEEGEYAFPAMEYGGAYVVDPSKNTDPMNGVSTLDLVLIQKHILTLQDLDSPYKIIAADINKDQNITALDLVELRKLILGIYTEFPQNESWRFVDAAYDLTDVDPLSVTLPETYNISELNSDMEIDFMAIKTGDVNGTAVVNLTNETAEFRGFNGKLSLNVDKVSFNAGDIVEIPFTADNTNNLLGYQFTLDFDESRLEYVGSEEGVVNVNAANFGLNRVNEGVITTSWNNANAVKVNSSETMFTLTFKAIADGEISNTISISSEYTVAEAYNQNAELLDVELRFGDDVSEFVLYQNTPNPFSETTTVGFDLPVAGNASMTFFDVAGKSLKVVRNYYNAGYNTVTVAKNELGTSGIIYYTLETANNSSTMKMVVLK